jgi:hypothetical protein
MRQHSTHTRDAALRRLSRANRWLIAGSVALTGVFAEVAAQAFPGKTRAPASGSSGAAGRHASGAGASSSGAGLSPPAHAPTAPSQTESAQGGGSPSEPSPQSGQGSEQSTPPEGAPEPAPAQEAAPPVVLGGY